MAPLPLERSSGRPREEFFDPPSKFFGQNFTTRKKLSPFPWKSSVSRPGEEYFHPLSIFYTQCHHEKNIPSPWTDHNHEKNFLPPLKIFSYPNFTTRKKWPPCPWVDDLVDHEKNFWTPLLIFWAKFHHEKKS